MPDEHAPFSPSATSRWLKCPFAVDPRPGAVNPESPENKHSNRDTALHERGEAALGLNLHPVDGFKRPVTYYDPGKGTNVKLSDEETASILVPYVDGVRLLYEEAMLLYDEAKLRLEERVTLLAGQVWGTVDALVITPETIDVCDLKGGHTLVDVDEWLQGMTYACAVRREYPGRQITLHICQPAAEDEEGLGVDGGAGWTHRTVSREELDAHETAIRHAVAVAVVAWESKKRATEEDIGKHCGTGLFACPRKPTCPAHAAKLHRALDIADAMLPAKVIPPDPCELDEERLVWIVQNRKVLVDFVEACERHAVELLTSGLAPDTLADEFKVVEGQSRRGWNPDLDQDDLVKALRKAGVKNPLVVKESVVGITEAEKQGDKAKLAKLMVKPPGKPTLVGAKDKRPALDAAARAAAALAKADE